MVRDKRNGTRGGTEREDGLSRGTQPVLSVGTDMLRTGQQNLEDALMASSSHSLHDTYGLLRQARLLMQQVSRSQWRSSTQLPQG